MTDRAQQKPEMTVSREAIARIRKELRARTGKRHGLVKEPDKDDEKKE